VNRVCLRAGVGYGALIAAAWLNVFYIVVLAWAIYYLVASMSTELPWASCEHSWNTPSCRSYLHVCNETVETAGTCGRTNFTSPVREFWEYVYSYHLAGTLVESSDILCNMGVPDPQRQERFGVEHTTKKHEMVKCVQIVSPMVPIAVMGNSYFKSSLTTVVNYYLKIS